jgi:hypothetical protein
VLPYDGRDTCIAVFRQIDLLKAKLSSLEICGVAKMKVHIDDLLGNLPSIQGVQHLNADCIPLTYFPDSDSICSLQSLTIIPRRATDILEISLCTALQSLTIVGYYSIDFFGVGPYHLHLPRLNSLSVSGDLEALSKFTIECPVLEKLEMKPRDFFSAINPSTWLKPPSVLARRIHWDLDSWDEPKFINGMEAIVSVWDRTELIKVKASTSHKTVDATFDVQSKEFSLLQTQKTPDSWLGYMPGFQKRDDVTLVIRKWAEDNSFSFHENSTSQ